MITCLQLVVRGHFFANCFPDNFLSFHKIILQSVVLDNFFQIVNVDKLIVMYFDNFAHSCFGSVLLGKHEGQGGQSGPSVRIDQRGYFNVSFLIKDTERLRRFYFSPHPIYKTI